MWQIINNIIQYTQTGQYSMTTYEQYCITCCVGLIFILTVVTCDWLRQLFKALINKIR